MTDAPPLVAVAHGSRDPRSATTVAALTDLVRHQRPDLDVRLCFLDLSAARVTVATHRAEAGREARLAVAARQAETGGGAVADPFGADAGVAAVIIHRYQAAAQATDLGARRVAG